MLVIRLHSLVGQFKGLGHAHNAQYILGTASMAALLRTPVDERVKAGICLYVGKPNALGAVELVRTARRKIQR